MTADTLKAWGRLRQTPVFALGGLRVRQKRERGEATFRSTPIDSP